VSCGVPQGLVLGPLLLVVYVHDPDIKIGVMISKFTDDKKFDGVVNSEE